MSSDGDQNGWLIRGQAITEKIRDHPAQRLIVVVESNRMEAAVGDGQFMTFHEIPISTL